MMPNVERKLPAPAGRHLPPLARLAAPGAAALAIALCLGALLAPARAAGESVLRVGLLGAASANQCRVTVAPSGPQAGEIELEFRAGDGGLLLALRGNDVARVAPAGDGVVVRDGRGRDKRALMLVARARGGFVAVTKDSTQPLPYRGELEFTASGGRLRIVNTVELEGYLRSVVPAEMPRLFHEEALRAQAIVARTYALRAGARHAADGFDVCDSAHCQAYRGALAEAPETDAAVISTRGRVLIFDRALADISYHSSCGGHTAAAGDVWNGGRRLPYLAGVRDSIGGSPACAHAPQFWWSADISRDQLGRIAGGNGAAAAVGGLAVTRRSPEGRVLEVQIGSGGGGHTMSGYEFYRRCAGVLGWGKMRSAWFDVKPGSGGWRVIGRGAGHGVGMCQWGAQGRAESGASARGILQAYFPGTELHPLDTLAAR